MIIGGTSAERAVQHKLTYADLAALPESEGARYELLDGELYVTPSPGTLHQRVSFRLARILDEYFRAGNRGEVFTAPTDLVLTEHDVAVPDLVVVTRPADITDRAIEGPPAIVVEILSPSTRSRDLGLKMQRYAALGLSQYWIVDPAKRSIACYRLDETRVFRSAGRAEGDAVLSAPDWPGLTIRFADLWPS